MAPAALTSNLCIDFGTAMSKAAVFLGEGEPARAQPLAIGAAAGAAHPYLAPSILFVDQGRILFGPPALVRARSAISAKRDPLLSFKSILAAQSPADALSLKVRPSIDPTGTLRHRDALTLYLAYLFCLIERARAGAGIGALDSASLRYTSPRWRAQASIEAAMGEIFARARTIADQLSDALLSAEGVSIAQAKDSLTKSERAGPLAVTCVMESHAAAIAHASYASQTASHLLVIDMGAGTTDLAGFRRGEDGALVEIGQAQQTTGLGNDEIDTVLVDLMLRKAGRRVKHADDLWRSARLNGRALKEQVFASGRCTLEIEGKSISVRRDDLLKEDMFKEFRRALSEACDTSLSAVAAIARKDKANSVCVLLAGGGSNLAFVREMAASLSGARGLQLETAVFGENWPLAPSDDPSTRPALPQIGVAMGGAIARFADAPAPAPASAS